MLESCYWIKGSVKPRLIVKHVGFEVLVLTQRERSASRHVWARYPRTYRTNKEV